MSGKPSIAIVYVNTFGLYLQQYKMNCSANPNAAPGNRPRGVVKNTAYPAEIQSDITTRRHGKTGLSWINDKR